LITVSIPLVIFAIVLGAVVLLGLLAALLYRLCFCCSATANPEDKALLSSGSGRKKTKVIGDLKLPPFILARLLEEHRDPLHGAPEVNYPEQQLIYKDQNGIQNIITSAVAQFGGPENRELRYRTVVRVPWPIDYSSTATATNYAANKLLPRTNSSEQMKKKNKKMLSIAADDDPFDVNYPFSNYPTNRFSTRPSYAYSNYSSNPIYRSNAKTPQFTVDGRGGGGGGGKMYPRLSEFSPLSVSQLPTYSAAQRPAIIELTAQPGLDQPDASGTNKPHGSRRTQERIEADKALTTVVNIGSSGENDAVKDSRTEASDQLAPGDENPFKPVGEAVTAADDNDFRSIVVLE